MASMRSRGGGGDAQVLSLDGPPPTASSDRPKTPRRPGTSSGRSKQAKATEFRTFLENDELPLAIETSPIGGRRRVVWTTNLDQLDLAHFLPLCLGGIQESLAPYADFACDAAMQLLESASHNDTRVLKCLPQAVAQLKSALGTREKDVVHRALVLLQQLTVCDGVGEALGDHYRALLPLCNILQDKHLGTGDELTRGMVAEALETMEAYGRDDAHMLIQQYVPTFTSQFPSDRLVST
jgi:hypothetical protein